MPRTVTAHAPASVGNVAVGFDLLGHALEGPGDRVTASLGDFSGVRITAVTGCVTDLPLQPEDNTAGRAVLELLRATGSQAGILLSIDKGIALASGLGGSAASCVAALVATNELLDLGLSRTELYPFSLAGETVASGSAHGDNVGCQLLGGLVLATADRLIPIPVPDGLTAVAVHPDYRVATREARQCLDEPFPIATVVAQTTHLALVLDACHRGDLEQLAAGLADVLVEPRRARLIPGFDAVKRAALTSGALGASISGAGPTVFGWFDSPDRARPAGNAMQAAFAEAGLESDVFVSPVAAAGAAVVESG